MTIEEIKNERRRLEAQVDMAVKQFRERCGLEDWQVEVHWGRAQVSTQVGNGPQSTPSNVYMTVVSVRA